MLCGGRSTRFTHPTHGGDKLSAPLGPVTVLAATLAGFPCSWPVVAVGPLRPLRDATGEVLPHRVRWCRERPAFAGPVAALAAGLRHCRTDAVLLLGGDMPLASSAGQALVAQQTAHPEQALVGVTPDGRVQPLLGCYPTQALREALTHAPTRLMQVLEHLPWRAHSITTRDAHDIDSAADLARARPMVVP